MTRPIIQSYGGGTQSIAIVCLCLQGELPMPERFIIADTSREASETWEYLDRYIQPLLAKVGKRVEIAPHSLARRDLFYQYQKSVDLLIPAHTNQSGEHGQLRTFCSDQWKREVIARYLGSLGYGPKNPVIQWIGISKDEIGRAKPSQVKWIDVRWPLLFGYGVTLTRRECRQAVLDFGLPEPPKSSCWLCPHRQDKQWIRLRDKYPQDWQKAIETEREFRQRDPHAFLHRSCVPLDQAELIEKPPKENPLFGQVSGCDSGYCWV